MTKGIPVRKNTTGNHGQDVEEEASASEGETETVEKPTGKAPDTECLGHYRNYNGRECSNSRIEIGAVGIKNLEDLANRKLLSDCQNTSTLIIPNRKLLYN